jgi:hypothetical protein
MRIDSSGNLLVGKTSFGTTTEGAEVRNNGLVAAARDLTGSSGSVLYLNRIGTTDGPIQTFYKDDALVGTIGNAGARLFINSGNVGLNFAGDGSNQILPSNAGVNRDDAISLGTTNVRFKDLYLSGGAYIGGTGSANYLDDYETGDFDPAITRATTGVSTTYEYQRGYYIKVGALVTLFINIKTNTVSNTGSGSVVITNLPFASTSDVGFRASGSIAYQDMFSTTTVENLRLNMPESSSAIYLMVQDLDSITVDSNLVANPLSARFLQASITYKTDS